ncbi:MAG TPA: A/G-specific adenine glycosylase [Gammaproteobacteria bacterium]
MKRKKQQFSRRVLAWFDVHGRKDLPWQQDRNPYRVWISEIMLQQTQVATVIPYFQRFMQRFPDIIALADAPVDDVLQHWSGLGYYARARNLHKTARIVRDEHGGVFPTAFDDVQALPGIGRSTAGAILAQALDQRHPILDGNVKRVLARYFAVDGWPGENAVAAALWEHAEALTPHARAADYTQAMMDLGAIVCRRGKPLCAQCPVADDCRARAAARVHELPASKPKRALPVKDVQMLLITNAAGEFLLERRPPSGIWGGLLGFPEIAPEENPVAWAQKTVGHIEVVEAWSILRHTFSHFHLNIKPVIARIESLKPQIMSGDRWLWFDPQASVGGLAAPVRKLMQKYQGGQNNNGQLSLVDL